MSCRFLVHTHAYIHIHICIYIYTHALHTSKSKISKQTHTHTHTHTLFSVVKKGGKRGLMIPMSLFGEGKSKSLSVFLPKVL